MASLTRPLLELVFEPDSSDLLASMIAGHAHILSHTMRLTLLVKRKRGKKQAVGQMQCYVEEKVTLQSPD